ncbi:MAG: hypothetical protein ACLFRR_11540 [Spirochaetaceae bacterium]
MKTKRSIMVLAVALMALVAVGTVSAEYPKAKAAEDSVCVEAPDARSRRRGQATGWFDAWSRRP